MSPAFIKRRAGNCLERVQRSKRRRGITGHSLQWHGLEDWGHLNICHQIAHGPPVCLEPGVPPPPLPLLPGKHSGFFR